MNRLPGGVPPGSFVRRPPAEALTDPLRSWACVVAATASVVAGLVLATRRLAGGFTGAEPGLVWLTLGGGLVLLGIADGLGRGGRGMATAITARVGLLIAVAAVTLPPRPGDWVSILALGMAAAVAVLPPPRLRHPRRVARRQPPMPEARRPGAAVVPPAQPATPVVPEIGEPSTGDRTVVPVPAVAPPAGKIVQRLERFESAEGADCIAGHVRLSIPLGGKATHAHVGFCPAFAATPTVEVSTDYDGVEAIVTAAEVLPWGVRIECRLSEPAEEPLEIPVELVAKSSR